MKKRLCRASGEDSGSLWFSAQSPNISPPNSLSRNSCSQLKLDLESVALAATVRK